MSEIEQKEAIRKIVANFTREYVDRHLRWKIGQIIPGADTKIPHLPYDDDKALLSMTMEPREWLDMALFGAGLLPGADPGEMYEICQSLAEWMFALPGYAQYTIPSEWYEIPMGALWAAALIKVQGDALITIAEAAAIAGISVQAISQRVKRGTLQSFVDPVAPERQGKRLVKRSDIEKDN